MQMEEVSSSETFVTNINQKTAACILTAVYVLTAINKIF
jgi:hypothetical protein